jgi:hypothetical protein
MAKQLPPQVQQVLMWAKANTLVVVFCAIVVVVPVGSYFGAEAFSSGVRAGADKRAQVYNDLETAAKAKVELPIPGGQSFPLAGLPNEAVVQEYEQILVKVSDDARAVYGSARTFNTGSSGNPKHVPAVDPAVFPGYSRANRAERESVRLKVGEGIRQAYERLLADCRIGRPPEASSMTSAIEAAEKRFVQGELKQESRAKLDSAQVELLDKHLGKARIEQYFEVAKKTSFYLDPGAIELPSKESINQLLKAAKDEQSQSKALDDHDSALFELQWKFWVVADVMRAFSAANGSTPSVLQAPVKRVLRIQVLPSEKLGAPASGGEASPMGGEQPTAEAPADGAAAPAATVAVASAKLGAPNIDPKVDAPRDYSKRFTGRVSNPVYDVRLAEVTFVAETAKLPKVLDALGAQNLMTVANVRVSQADPFAAAREGYLYGAEPVSLVTATVESIWLREWTAPFMPAAVRTALGIQSATAEGAPEEAKQQAGM